MQILNLINGVSQNPAMKLVQLGVNCAGEKKFEQALTHWRQALEIEPNNYLHHSNICRILNVLGRHAQAISYGQKAVKLNEKQAYTHMNLALAYAGKKRFQQAQKQSKIGFDLNPNNPLCCIDRAHILDQLGKTEEADKFYEMANKLNNSQSRIKFNQDHINETLERKFKRLVQYIDNMAGKQNEKKQLKEDVQGLKKEMIESQFIIEAFDKLMKKQGNKKLINEQTEMQMLKEIKIKFNSVQHNLEIISSQCSQLVQNSGKMVQVVHQHEVKIEVINAQVKRLRNEMKTCQKDFKKMQNLLQRIQILEKKMSDSPSLGSKKGSRPQSERISAKDLESINDQLMDIIEQSAEGVLMIVIKIQNSSEMNQSSISSFCKHLKKLINIETFHLILKNAQQSFLNKLKDHIIQMNSLTNVKIVSENGQENLNSFKQEISKKKSINCEILIKK